MQARLTELEAEGSSAAAALDAAEDQLAEAQQGLSDATAQLVDTEEQLAEARDEAETAKTRLVEVEAAVAQSDSSADADRSERWVLPPIGPAVARGKTVFLAAKSLPVW